MKKFRSAVQSALGNFVFQPPTPGRCDALTVPTDLMLKESPLKKRMRQSKRSKNQKKNRWMKRLRFHAPSVHNRFEFQAVMLVLFVALHVNMSSKHRAKKIQRVST